MYSRGCAGYSFCWQQVVVAALIVIALGGTVSAAGGDGPIGFAKQCYGVLGITSTPSGATVFIDGVNRGVTPLSNYQISMGPHSIRVSAGMHADATETLTVSCDKTYAKQYTLAPIITTTPVPDYRPPVAVQLQDPVKVQPEDPQVVQNNNPVQPVGPQVPPPVQPRVPVRSDENKTVTPVSLKNYSLSPPVAVRVKPVEINVRGRTYRPIISTVSPFFPYQNEPADSVSLNAYRKLHGDYSSVLLPGSFLWVTSVDQKGVEPLCSPGPCKQITEGEFKEANIQWKQSTTILVNRSDTVRRTYFRWAYNITANDKVHGFWQVSRLPFPTDSEHWQNKYVPGLVASGPVNPIGQDAEGNQWIWINFAPIANQNPAAPPLYLGKPGVYTSLGSLDETYSIQKINLGFTEVFLTNKKTPVVAPYLIWNMPTKADFLRKEFGQLLAEGWDPTRDTYKEECEGCDTSSTPIGDQIVDQNQTFYVRVIPIYEEKGAAGIPSFPVTVTVARDHPCPPVEDVLKTVTIKPPSVSFASFYMTQFTGMSEPAKDDNGEYISRARYVSIAKPDNCGAMPDVAESLQECLKNSGTSVLDCFDTKQQCFAFYSLANGQVGYHFFIDPPEKEWYNVVLEFIRKVFTSFKALVDYVSSTYNQIKNTVIEYAASLCGGGDLCKQAAGYLVNAGMTALGLPPTIPNYSDLQNMGYDYLVKVGVEQIGAEDLYTSLDSAIKAEMKSDAIDTFNKLTLETQKASALAAGNWYTLDPLYYEPHPATIVVRVQNPNSERSDIMSLSVSDSAHLFKAKAMPVPSLGSGESVSIPIVLEENYETVYEPGCDDREWTYNGPIPCYRQNWNWAVSNAKADEFRITLSTKKDGYYIYDISQQSSGTTLTEIETVKLDWQVKGGVCADRKTTTILKLPDGWKATTSGMVRNLPEDWAFESLTFSNGPVGTLKMI